MLPDSVWKLIRTYSEQSNVSIPGPLAYILANQTRGYSGVGQAVRDERNRILTLLRGKVSEELLLKIVHVKQP